MGSGENQCVWVGRTFWQLTWREGENRGYINLKCAQAQGEVNCSACEGDTTPFSNWKIILPTIFQLKCLSVTTIPTTSFLLPPRLRLHFSQRKISRSIPQKQTARKLQETFTWLFQKFWNCTIKVYYANPISHWYFAKSVV